MIATHRSRPHRRPGALARSALVVISAGALCALGLTVSATAAANADASQPTLPDGCTQASVGGTVTCTYTYTGAEQTFTVPAAVTSVDLSAVGAAGGADAAGSSSGGSGGTASLNGVAVTAGHKLYVEVGGVGGDGALNSPGATHNGGFNGGGNGGASGYMSGGGGGGASDVRTVTRTDLLGPPSLPSRLIVAAGGGGGCNDGTGGGPGKDGTSPGANTAGGGATTTKPGAGGYIGGRGFPGTGGIGQAGSDAGQGGCGGGGGYYGGGGGSTFGSGGGGSNYAPGGTTGTAAADEAASVTISYTPTGVAAAVTKKAGDNQSAMTGKAFPTDLAVTVTDANGKPVGSGTSVTFAVASGSASFPGSKSSAAASTDSSGVVTAPTLTAGSSTGAVTVTAALKSDSSVSVTFTETVTAPTTRYVATAANGGSDGTTVNPNDCTDQDNPCATIGQAVSQAIDTDTISVGPGTFTEHVAVGKNLTITGSAGGTTVDANGAGDALSVGSGATVTLKRLTLIGGAGNGLVNNGTVTVIASTITGNGNGNTVNAEGPTVISASTVVAGSSGDGVYAGAPVRVVDSTVIGQVHALDPYDGTISVAGSLIASRSGSSACRFVVADRGHNIASDSSCGAGFATGDLHLQAALTGNGGPTKTVAPASGSPAVDQIPAGTTATVGSTTYTLCPGSSTDTGDPAATDQRGVARPQGGSCDIGAVEDAATTITLSSQANPAAVGKSVTLTASVASALNSPTLPTPTGAVTFAASGTTIGGCGARTVTNGTASCTVGNLTVGKHKFGASYTGANGYRASSDTLTQQVDETAQTITFAQPADAVYGQADTALTATSDSGLPVRLASTTSAVCTVVSGRLHVLAAGTCRIEATQPGHGSYAAASPVTRTLTVEPAPLRIIASSASMVEGGSLPAVTPSYDGLVNGDTAPATSPTCAAGQATLTTTCSGAADPNYTISYVSGTLTVFQPLQVMTSTLPDATVGQPYTATLHAGGGPDSAYHWALSSGSLPPGLGLSHGGVISGTPSHAGTYTFTVSVNDPANQTLTLTVAPARTGSGGSSAGSGTGAGNTSGTGNSSGAGGSGAVLAETGFPARLLGLIGLALLLAGVALLTATRRRRCA